MVRYVEHRVIFLWQHCVKCWLHQYKIWPNQFIKCFLIFNFASFVSVSIYLFCGWCIWRFWKTEMFCYHKHFFLNLCILKKYIYFHRLHFWIKTLNASQSNSNFRVLKTFMNFSLKECFKFQIKGNVVFEHLPPLLSKIFFCFSKKQIFCH